MSELRAAGVSFHFADGIEVLKDINLTVAVGEMTAILGENASGKTTLLRILAGLLAPSSGAVTVNDTPVHRISNRVGIVFQNPDHQMISATVEEEIALGLELRGVPQELMRPRVEELLVRFQLSELRFATPESLSGGQKQRVALAAAMSAGPQILLFDEPDSLLDAPSRAELHAAVRIVRETCGIVWTCPHPKRMPDATRRFELRNGILKPL